MERDDPARRARMETYSGSKIKGLARWRERGDNKERSLEDADISISGSHCCSSKLRRERLPSHQELWSVMCFQSNPSPELWERLQRLSQSFGNHSWPSSKSFKGM